MIAKNILDVKFNFESLHSPPTELDTLQTGPLASRAGSGVGNWEYSRWFGVQFLEVSANINKELSGKVVETFLEKSSSDSCSLQYSFCSLQYSAILILLWRIDLLYSTAALGFLLWLLFQSFLLELARKGDFTKTQVSNAVSLLKENQLCKRMSQLSYCSERVGEVNIPQLHLTNPRYYGRWKDSARMKTEILRGYLQ